MNPPLFLWLRTLRNYFRGEIRPERPHLALLAALGLAATGVNTVLIWKVGTAVSEIAKSQFDQLKQTLLLVALLVLIQQALRLAHAYSFQLLTLRFIERVRDRVLNHVLAVSFPLLGRFAKGDLLVRLGGDIDKLLTFFVNAPLNFASNVILVAVYVSMLFWIDWRLALIAVAAAPLFYLTQQFVAPRAGEASRQLTCERTSLFALREQALSNLRGISGFTGEQAMRGRHQRQFDRVRNWTLRLRRIRVLNNAFTTLLVFLTTVLVVFSGVSAVQSGRLELGALVSFLVYLRFAVFPIRNIAHIPVKLEADRPAAERIIELLSVAPEVDPGEEKPPLTVLRGDIEFDHVHFTYPGNGREVFAGISERIKAGETVALVGPSGAGKSTLANLLLRFYDPQQGVIRIDGTDIRTVSVASLRRQVAIVWQEPLLIDGSLRDNLLLARPDAAAAEIDLACEASYCADFINSLPQGLDTALGPNGVTLSVGQRQRIAIAQAFLRDTPILILDEASSALDSQSEQVVARSLENLRRERTTLVIAHRYSSIRSADRVLYFAGDGSVIAGTHQELLERVPHYQDAVAWQTKTR